MIRFTARVVAPEALTATELTKALESIGCHLEVQPMAGNRPALRQQALVLPLRARPSTAPDFMPELL